MRYIKVTCTAPVKSMVATSLVTILKSSKNTLYLFTIKEYLNILDSATMTYGSIDKDKKIISSILISHSCLN